MRPCSASSPSTPPLPAGSGGKAQARVVFTGRRGDIDIYEARTLAAEEAQPTVA